MADFLREIESEMRGGKHLFKMLDERFAAEDAKDAKFAALEAEHAALKAAHAKLEAKHAADAEAEAEWRRRAAERAELYDLFETNGAGPDEAERLTEQFLTKRAEVF
jgi:predicted flap endonuclease-1-like 5' DNA nuclease